MLKKLVRTGLCLLMSGMFLVGGFSTPVSAHAETPDTTLRIGTFNIAAGKKPNVDTLRELTDKYNLETVGIQEVDVNNGRNNYDMLEKFTTNNYTSNYFSKAIDFSGGAYGTGTVSRYPLTDTSTTPVDTEGANEKRVIQRSVFTKDGKQIAFYNVHLSWEKIEIRERQFAQLKEMLAADPIAYKIVVGDFNADQYVGEFYTFLDTMDIANGYDGNWFETFNGVDNTMLHNCIDNILVTRNIQFNHIENVATKLSDHNLFWAEVKLLDQPAVSYQWLKAMVGEYQNMDTTPYSPASVSTFKAALANAQAGIGQATTQDYADALTKNLIRAAAELTTDKAALEAVVAEAETLTEANYTKESWAQLAPALSEAKAVVANQSASQPHIDAVAADLNNAMKALVKTPEAQQAEQNQQAQAGEGNTGAESSAASEAPADPAADKSSVNGDKTAAPSNSLPQTGDAVGIWVLLMGLLTVAGAGTVGVYFLRKYKRENAK